MTNKEISRKIKSINLSPADRVRVTPHLRKSRSKVKKGYGTWYLRIFINSKQYGSDLYIGMEPEATKYVAKSFATEIKKKLIQGKVSEVFTDYPTLSEFKEEYFEYIKNVKMLRSYGEYIPAINRFLKCIGNKIITQYTSYDILKYLQLRLKDKILNRPNDTISCIGSGSFDLSIRDTGLMLK